jgi:hypothetical protein
MVPRLLRRGARTVAGWSPDERDAVLYSASALFAVITIRASGIPLYRQWGELAVGPYALAALASAFMARRHRSGSHPRRRASDPLGSGPVPAPAGPTEGAEGWHWNTSRTAIFLLVLVGATLMPLSLEVLWRTDSGSSTHVQPEVQVIEQSGDRVASGQSPYQKINPAKPPPVAQGEPSYDAFNPYLPLMSLFGLARSTHASPRLTDARVAFSLLTILLAVGALGMTRGRNSPRQVTLQSMTVLPTAALPLATGGDDVPVAAIMLLGLVLLQRRRPLLAGLVLGVSASMKITAWPLAVIAILVVTDREGERTGRARLLFAGGLAGVMIPAVLPSALNNFSAFVQNVVRFPLGLAGVTSPAASPLLGHVFVTAFPSFHEVFTVAIVVLGSIALGWALIRRTPRTPSNVSRLLGWAMAVAICLAPATRLGYMLYPVDFFIWAWLLHSEELAEGRNRIGSEADVDEVPAAVA